MTPRTFTSEGIVLKRRNFSEADRLVTIFTKRYGKLTALAKGVRKLSSRKKGALEPATLSQCFFASGKSLPLITQTNIINNFSQARTNLTRLTQTFQILEIVDNLTAEGEEQEDVYQLIIDSLKLLEKNGTKKQALLSQIIKLVQVLGFGPPANFDESNLKNYIEELSNRRLKSKSFLTPGLRQVK